MKPTALQLLPISPEGVAPFGIKLPPVQKNATANVRVNYEVMADDQSHIEKEYYNIQSIIEATENDFEQKLLYISSGALVLSLTLLEKVLKFENCQYVSILVLGWILLVVALLINLVSQQVSAHYLRLQLKEINEGIEYRVRSKRIASRNGKTICINWITITLLFLGIGCIIFFSAQNAILQSKQKTNTTMCKKTSSTPLNEGRTAPTPYVEQRGRTSAIPFSPAPTQQGSSNSSGQSQSTNSGDNQSSSTSNNQSK